MHIPETVAKNKYYQVPKNHKPNAAAHEETQWLRFLRRSAEQSSAVAEGKAGGQQCPGFASLPLPARKYKTHSATESLFPLTFQEVTL